MSLGRKNTSHTTGCNNKNLKPVLSKTDTVLIEQSTLFGLQIITSHLWPKTKEYVLFIFASGGQIFLNENRKYSLTLVGMKRVHYPAWGRKHRETLLILLQSLLVAGKKKSNQVASHPFTSLILLSLPLTFLFQFKIKLFFFICQRTIYFWLKKGYDS